MFIFVEELSLQNVRETITPLSECFLVGGYVAFIRVTGLEALDLHHVVYQTFILFKTFITDV